MKRLLTIIKKNYFVVLLLLIISSVNLRSFFRPGIFQTHDSEMHLARIANYYLAIKDGHFPVRWAKNLNHKFGYPVFNYNYPLANMAAYPLIVIGFSLETSLKIILFSAYFSAGLFFYLWLKKHFSSWASFTAAIFYLTSPYQFLDLYVRGTIGETITFALWPAVLYFLKLFAEKKTKWRFLWLILVTALFSLSHNIMVMLFTPLIFLYYFYLNKKRIINSALLGLILGFGLTLFFWLPAYFERSLVTLEAFDSKTFFQEHFVYLKQLIWSSWQYGFSMLGPEDTMSFQIGPIHLLVVFSVLFLMFTRHSQWKKNKLFLLGGLVLVFLSIFLMLPVSQFVWRVIPLLGYLQFPWRFLSLTMFSISVLAGVLSQQYKKWGLILALAALIYCQQFTQPFFWEKKDDMYYYDYLFTTSTLHENMPRWFNEENINTFKSRLTSDSGLVTFRELEWKTNKHVYEINVPEKTNIWEHTAYLPGWEVYIDGQKAKIKYDRPDNRGIIGMEVPAGTHKIVTKFTQRTPARIIGNLMSIGSLILVLAELGFLKIKKIRKLKLKK